MQSKDGWSFWRHVLGRNTIELLQVREVRGPPRVVKPKPPRIYSVLGKRDTRTLSAARVHQLVDENGSKSTTSSQTKETKMSTQDAQGITFSVSPEESREQFRLLELPPELLELITTNPSAKFVHILLNTSRFDTDTFADCILNRQTAYLASLLIPMRYYARPTRHTTSAKSTPPTPSTSHSRQKPPHHQTTLVRLNMASKQSHRAASPWN